MRLARTLIVGARNTRTTAVGLLAGVALAWIAVHYWSRLPDGIGEALLVLAAAHLAGGLAARDAEKTSEQVGAREAPTPPPTEGP